MPGPKHYYPRKTLKVEASGTRTDIRGGRSGHKGSSPHHLPPLTTKRHIPDHSSLDAAVLAASLFTPPADENVLPHVKRAGTRSDKPRWIQFCDVTELSGASPPPRLSADILEEARIDLDLGPNEDNEKIVHDISKEIIERMYVDGLGAICNLSLGHNVVTVMLSSGQPIFSTNKPADRALQDYIRNCRELMQSLTDKSVSLFPHHAPSLSDREKHPGLWDVELTMAATVYQCCYQKVHHRFMKSNRGKIIIDTISEDLLMNGAVDAKIAATLRSIVEALTKAHEIIAEYPIPKTDGTYSPPPRSTLEVLHQKLLVVSVLLRKKEVRRYIERLGTRLSYQLHRSTLYVLYKISSLSNSLNNLAFVSCSPHWRETKFRMAEWLPLPSKMPRFNGKISEKAEVMQWYKESISGSELTLPDASIAWRAVHDKARSWKGWQKRGFENREGAGKHQIIQTPNDGPCIHCESILIQRAIEYQATTTTNRYIGCSKLSCHPCYTHIRAVNDSLNLKTYKLRFKVKGSHGKGYAPWTCAKVGTDDQAEAIHARLVRYLWEDVGRMIRSKQVGLSDSEPDDGVFSKQDEHSFGG